MSASAGPRERDEFAADVKAPLFKRQGGLCANPDCRTLTTAAHSTNDGSVTTGVAAHICAAAPGGPRYEVSMTRDERRSQKNGIWLCASHAQLIDRDVDQFTPELLRRWKDQAETDARRAMGADADGATGVSTGPVLQVSLSLAGPPLEPFDITEFATAAAVRAVRGHIQVIDFIFIDIELQTDDWKAHAFHRDACSYRSRSGAIPMESQATERGRQLPVRRR